MIVAAEKSILLNRLHTQPTRKDVLTLPFFHVVQESGVFFNLSHAEIRTMKLQLTQLRNPNTDKDTFRSRVAGLTQYLLRAIGADHAKTTEVETPLGVKTEGLRLEIPPVAFFYINRAGLTMALEAARYLPEGTPIGELDISRNETTLEGMVKGFNLPPDISGRKVILLDVMNATGGTIEAAWRVINKFYQEKGIGDVYVANIIAAPMGVKVVRETIPDAEILTIALDNKLTIAGQTPFPSGYIVPGLGDAGDRQFGPGRSVIFQRIRNELTQFVDFENTNRIFQKQ